MFKVPIYILSTIIALALLWQVSLSPYLEGDHRQTTWLAGMDKCVKTLQIPCRFVPDLDGMYGYPLFNYYAPLPYLVGEVFYLFTQSFSSAVKLTWLTSFLILLIFTPLFWQQFFKGWRVVVLSCISVILTPVILMTYFTKQAEGLVLSLALLAALFWYFNLLAKNLRVYNLILAACLLSLFILSYRLNIFFLIPLLIISYNFTSIKKLNFRLGKYIFLTVILSLLITAFFWVPLVLEKDGTYKEFSTGQLSEEFLPSYPPKHLSRFFPSGYQLLTGRTEVIDYQKKAGLISFKTNTEEHTIIRLSEYYFPGWKIFVDGEEVKMDYKNSLGMMTFLLGDGEHIVEARLSDTPVRIIANSLTILGLILFLILSLTQINKIRHWIIYYLRSFKR